jgi:choice-of-anchor B domain-containing protein
MTRLIAFLLCLPLLLQSQNVNNILRSKTTIANQTLANVYGYAANGKEYALLGAAQGMIIADVTNPDAPVQIVQIPGPNNLWKEIKTYKNFAYCVSEGGQGLQIIDLTNLPAANLSYWSYRGDGAINNQLNKAHALHIDTKKGFLYLYGTNLFSGAPVVLNLEPNPYQPTYAGKFTQLGYVHDGYVENDTMFSGHIYQGLFAVVNMADKANPVLLASQMTPNAFTHNTWLTDDHKTLLTTDEVTNSFLASYDISNLQNIKLLDKIQSNPGSSSIVHNTHIRGNFAITSWYKDGFTITDVSRPANLVQTGNFDTWTAAGTGFEGCWGVYPFLPSGNLIATNINAAGNSNSEWFMVTPTYTRACHLEGTVRSATTLLPLIGVKVEVIGLSPALFENTNIAGEYKMGTIKSGHYTLKMSKSGYQSVENEVYLESGGLILIDELLYPNGNLVVSGKVVNSLDSVAIGGAVLHLYGRSNNNYSATSDANGNFIFPNVVADSYEFVAWGNGFGLFMQNNQVLTKDSVYFVQLYKYHRRGDTVKGRGEAASNPTVSPNPSAGSFSMETENLPIDCEILVCNALGQKVFYQKNATFRSVINFGEFWTKGVYFLKILSKKEILTSEILVKE